MNSTPPPGYTDHVSFGFIWWYNCVGFAMDFFIFFANVAFLLTILRHQRFRSQKEYVIMGANMLFDVIFVMMYFTNALSGLRIYLSYDKYIPLFTAPHCLWQVHSLLTIYATPCSGPVMLFTTIDRFLSVTFPMKYTKFGTRYALGLMAMAYLCPMPTFVATVVQAYGYPADYRLDESCNLFFWMRGGTLLADQIIRGSSTAIGACLYVPIVYRVWRIFVNKKSYGNGNFSRADRKRLRRMTLTIMLITATELGTLTIPDLFYIFLPTWPGNYYLMLLTNAKGRFI